MARSRELRVVISGDPRSLNRAFGQAAKDAGRLEGSVKRMGGTVSRSMRLAGAAIAGGLVVETGRMVSEFREAEKVTKQTAAVLKSTGGAAKVTAGDVERLANAISLKAGVDDEAIQSAQNLLLTFTQVRNEAGRGNDVFNQATQTITDMSAALGQDLNTSAIQVGKALNDPVRGITALRRVGVSFTDQQREQIKTLVEQGRTLDAQKIILRELGVEFGGSAEAQADAFDKAKVAVENLEEAIGRLIGPALASAATAVATFVTELQNGTGAGGRFRDTLVNTFNAVKGAVQTAIGAVSGFLQQNRDQINSYASSLQQIFQNGLIPVLEFLLSVARRVFPGIVSYLRGAATVIGGIVKVISGVLTGDFGKAWEGVKQIFRGGVQAALGIVRAVTAPMREAGARVGAAVLGALGDAWRRIRDVASSAFSSALNVVRGYLGAYRSAATAVARAVVAAFNFLRELPGRIGGLLAAGARKVGEWAGNFRDRALTVGKAVVDGLVSGISRLGGAIVNAGKELGRKLIDAVKNFLGISSPSRAFMEVGKNVVAGLARGLDAGDIPKVVRRHFGGMAKLAASLVKAGVVDPIAALIGGTSVGGFARGNTRKVAEGFAERFGLRITSGYRTPAENRAAGGVPNSRHTRGTPANPGAWDLVGSEQAMQAAAAAARRAGLPEVLVHDAGSGRHLHLGFFQRGGVVPGSGSGDKVPVAAMLEPGEIFGVLNRKAASAVQALNGMFPRFQRGGTLGIGQLVGLAQRAGFRGTAAARMAAEAMGESGGNPRARGDGGLSHGLWQIHTPSHPELARRYNLFDPWGNAQAARRVYLKHGRSFSPWHADHRPHMAAALRALRGGSTGGGSRGGRGGFLPDAPSITPESGILPDSFPTATGKPGFTPGGKAGLAPRGVLGEAGATIGADDVGGEDAVAAAISAQAEAIRENTEALKSARDEIKRQTDFANSVVATENFQLAKGLADILSGHIAGYGIAGRRLTAGAGQVARSY